MAGGSADYTHAGIAPTSNDAACSAGSLGPEGGALPAVPGLPFDLGPSELAPFPMPASWGWTLPQSAPVVHKHVASESANANKTYFLDWLESESMLHRSVGPVRRDEGMKLDALHPLGVAKQRGECGPLEGTGMRDVPPLPPGGELLLSSKGHTLIEFIRCIWETDAQGGEDGDSLIRTSFMAGHAYQEAAAADKRD